MLMMMTTMTRRRRKRKRKRKWRVPEEDDATPRMTQLISHWCGQWQQALPFLLVSQTHEDRQWAS
jgi:hypothetical protein